MNINCEKRIAARIKVEITGDINDYARSFLAIYNNVKNDSDLLKIYNDYENGIYVVCETEVKDDVVKFLEQFGNVKRIETVEIVQPIAYDYSYREDMDTEFVAAEEL